MVKNYTKKSFEKEHPRKETIQFLLNYSQSFKMIKLKNEEPFELYLN